MQHRNPDQLDCICIKRNAEAQIKTNGQIRYGQAVFNVAYSLYPEAVNKLRNTKFDCFYEDSKVDKFLLELQTL